MIAPLDEVATQRGGELLDRWRGEIRDLPPAVQRVALANGVTWRNIVEALVDPAVVANACEAFTQGVEKQLVARHRAGSGDLWLTRVPGGAERPPTSSSRYPW